MKIFSHQNDFWILQEENDPKHRSRLCTVWKAVIGANLIDNVWAWMKLTLLVN